MRFRVPLISCALIGALASCGKPDPVADNATAVNLPVESSESNPTPLGGPPSNASAQTSAPAPQPGSIPVALQGQWGLTPGDCTSKRGDAKGLLIVSSNQLRFYESRAVPSPGAQADTDSINGNFDFTGEGQSWTKFEKLERKKDKLVRTESNPAASYTYAKC
jgi:hypothetical protein